jgi:hypothetical protein
MFFSFIYPFSLILNHREGDDSAPTSSPPHLTTTMATGAPGDMKTRESRPYPGRTGADHRTGRRAGRAASTSNIMYELMLGG